MEALWGRLENDAARGLSALDDDSVFSSLELTQAMKHFVALHFFRNSRNLKRWEAVSQARLQLGFDRLRSSHREGLAALAENQGLDPTSEPDLYAAFSDYALSNSEFDGLFQDLQTSWFERSGMDVRRAGLEVFDTQEGLVLSDLGTIALDANGIPTDAPFAEAPTLLLPVGPRLLVSLGPSNTRATLSSDRTQTLVRQLLQTATYWAYSHPADDHTQWISD